MNCAQCLAKPLIPVAQKRDPVVAVSPLYSTPAQPPRLGAVPTDQDFIAALQGLGIKTQQAGQGDEAKQQVMSESQEQQPAKGTMYHLQLVLHTLVAVCTYKSKVGHQKQELCYQPSLVDALVHDAHQSCVPHPCCTATL